jgi:hypothetical protein
MYLTLIAAVRFQSCLNKKHRRSGGLVRIESFSYMIPEILGEGELIFSFIRTYSTSMKVFDPASLLHRVTLTLPFLPPPYQIKQVRMFKH